MLSPATGEYDLGSDTQYVVDMARKTKNPVYFYCLDEHKNQYRKIFKEKNVNVKVVSIDKYLNRIKRHARDEQLKKHAVKMIEIRKETLREPRHRVADRVMFKDAFSLFLLATQGGYVLDTSIRPNNEAADLTFNEYNHFRCPYAPENQDSPIYSEECWMMYAARQALHEPQAMMQHYLSGWDSAQRIICDKEREILIAFSNFMMDLLI